MASEPKPEILPFNDLANDYERMTSGATKHVAQHLIAISPPITSTSIIHDNASGTGVLTRTLLASHSTSTPTIHCTDASPAMISHLQSSITNDPSRWPNTTATVMPAEALAFSTATFSHSYTNFGILFFADAPQAAREIYRTLAPGGTAFVTTWADLGVRDVWRAVEARIRPADPPFEWPAAAGGLDWLDPLTLETVMRDAGFGEVQVRQRESARREGDVRTLVQCLGSSFAVPLRAWIEEEKGLLLRMLEEEVVRDSHFFVDELAGEVGVAMLANVAVCRK